MKKVIIIICSLIIFVCLFLGGFYVWGLGAVGGNEKVNFIIEAGTSKQDIAKNLQNAHLIRNEYVLDAYLYLTRPTIQAGEYELSPSMTPKEIINKFKNGDIVVKTVNVTLLEGETVEDYAETLSKTLSFTKEEFLSTIKDKEFLQSLLEKYWFLTDEVLNEQLYEPLEGYFYPDTYEFMQNASISDVVLTILNNTEQKLNTVKEDITNSGYTTHQILSLASLVEKEGITKEDRQKIAQVFYTRLSSNMPLGSDISTYYGVHKRMRDGELTFQDIYKVNPYNTRLTDGQMNGKLPIGPVDNASLDAIWATLHKTETNYIYFIANTCTKEVFFFEDYNSFLQKGSELRRICETN